MGRKKAHPVRSGAIKYTPNISKSNIENAVIPESETTDSNNSQISDCEKPFYVGISFNNSTSDEHLDIAEVVLDIVDFADEMSQTKFIERGLQRSDFSLRFRMLGVNEGSFRLGNWPVLPADHIFLDCGFLAKDLDANGFGPFGESSLLFTGTFDGPDEGISGLVHLVSQKLLTLRLIEEVGILRNIPSLRFRVEILNSAFDVCESLLEITRHPWRKSMMNLMSWIRPEVTTSEAIYGITGFTMESCDLHPDADNNLKQTNFNAAEFYEAIKPSKDEPMLEGELSNLLPNLRPYQRRAAYWMVQREKGSAYLSSKEVKNQLASPFCVPVNFLESNSKMFYNPFNGNVSLQPEYSPSYVSGGILADEMGLGKTVELLACVCTHRNVSLQDDFILDDCSQLINCQTKRPRLDRVECVCGAASENPRYKGVWVQCDICNAWQHAKCVGYSCERKTGYGKNSVVESDENYVCPMCSDLMEASKVKISTGATLIVCPGPILAQWNSEINRHTRSGALKICIYEGAKKLGCLTTMNKHISELAAADIVLTTYDVLKEDLSHDSDRHDGDRRFMRFQKKYPVIPTLLTRIHWWRLCLDEAQMVECNTASVTEMAMRLRAQHRWCITGTPIQRKLDDIYGLLRFLRATPFDIYRWWVEVIRDPYERKDVVAMEFVHRFFKQIMWRSSKVHVSDELQLPPQQESLSWLTFSPIEEHFYQKQHETCVRYAHEIIRTFKMEYPSSSSIAGLDVSSTISISHKDADKLLVTLLKLRQACCHPQVGSSGLCSLQSSPLTMEEILQVLIGKAKIEGEEELRKIVVALNGLAGLAIIENDSHRAVSLYREAMALAQENFNDFRVDPLLSIHMHHNLAELLQLNPEYSRQHPLMDERPSENSVYKRAHGSERFEQYYKRRKICEQSKNGPTITDMASERCGKLNNATANLSNPEGGNTELDAKCQTFCGCYSVGCLRETCEHIKQKYLSGFISKLSFAQQDFRKSHTQVCNIYKERKNESMIWWLHALDIIEKNKDASEDLLAKIDHAISILAPSSKSVKVTSRIRTIRGLKFTIQTGLDFLETSRETLMKQIMDIDRTMENPKDVDFERKRFCRKCSTGNGSLCIHCELDQLFQVYEAGLFLLKKASNGAVVACEEAIEMQKQKAALTTYFCETGTSAKTNIENEKGRNRCFKGGVQFSRSASPLEITLGVIKTFSKAILGRQGVTLARKHLVLLEAMRKEFAQARNLQVAQSQLFGAHDEIKMSTSRIRLKETVDELASISVLSREELVSHSMQYSSDKLLALASLSRIKGQLRYLKGLMVSNQKVRVFSSSMPEHIDDAYTDPVVAEESGAFPKTGGELCPICQEYISNPRMMFPCGHVICCKCCLQLTEKVRCLQKWVMCPTCRQHTDIEHIAYVDERKDMCRSLGVPDTFQASDKPESSFRVRGSYGTKIEAVTRRILWIASNDEEAKIIVFSSWNDVLDVLAHALDANDVTYVRMKGGRKSQDAVAKFKGLPHGMQDHAKAEDNNRPNSVRVLLILIRHGANGLNILEAQHVILVEPLLNPATEVQAISRVHRVGQEKKTFVHRFIVKNTVEESIYKLNASRRANSIVATRSKHKDGTTLTLQDVEALFPVTARDEVEGAEVSEGSFRHLPPAVAAGLAAERRLMESGNVAV